MGGEWIQIQFPAPTPIFGFKLCGRQDGNLFIYRSPRWITLVGSNDGATWTKIYANLTALTSWTAAPQSFLFDNSNYWGPLQPQYAYYRLVVHAVGNTLTVDANSVQLSQFELYRSMPPPQSALIGGAYGMAPWGSGSSFADPSAQYIWNRSDIANADGGLGLMFYKQYNHNLANGVGATLHIVCDNRAIVYWNGAMVAFEGGGGWTTINYCKVNVYVQNGVNTLAIYGDNADVTAGWAGLLVSLVRKRDPALTETPTIQLDASTLLTTGTL